MSKIAIHGCDDSTYIQIECTEEQVAFIKMLCDKFSLASTYGCMPTMEIDGYYGIDREED